MSVVVAILTRSPSDPRLKARIGPVVPDRDHRRDLVLAFLDDLLERVGSIRDVTVTVAVTPPLEGLRIARPWIAGNRLLLQRGVTFGDRLWHVFEDLATAGFRQIVLLGVDVPDLPPAEIVAAVRLVRANVGTVVTGPSGDGSFYLLGLTVTGHVPDLFTDVRWGTPHMLEDVEARARAAGLTVARTADWHDVDTPDDVQALTDRLRVAPSGAPHTADVLKTMGLL